MLNVRRLQILREVALRGSIRGAAQSLNYTTSAVSQHLTALEQECGVMLLERGHNAVRLTEAGHALVGHVDSILERLTAAETELQAFAGLTIGRLRLASFGSAALALMPAAIRAFSARFPAIDLSFFEADPEHTLPMLKVGDLDIALTYEYDFVGLHRESGIAYRPLVDEPMRLVVPRGHWAASRSTVALAELREEAWIVEPRADCRHFTVRACEEAGFKAWIRCESSDYAVTQALAATGLGLALVPDLALGTPRSDVVVKALEEPVPRRRVLAAYRASAEQLPAVRAMVEVLVATAQVASPGPSPRSRGPRTPGVGGHHGPPGPRSRGAIQADDFGRGGSPL